MKTQIKVFLHDGRRALVETEYDDVEGYHCITPINEYWCGRYNGNGTIISID